MLIALILISRIVAARCVRIYPPCLIPEFVHDPAGTLLAALAANGIIAIGATSTIAVLFGCRCLAPEANLNRNRNFRWSVGCTKRAWRASRSWLLLYLVLITNLGFLANRYRFVSKHSEFSETKNEFCCPGFIFRVCLISFLNFPMSN